MRATAGGDDDDAATVRVATEETPLLASHEGILSLLSDSERPSTGTATLPHLSANGLAGDDSDDDGEGKPLPVAQIVLLCYARWVEPVAFFSIFPYINKMAQENGHLAEADVGFYSGLIESLFSLTQMLVMLPWGRAADRFGRKPVLVVSLLGLSLSVALFGIARSIEEMILFRCLAGLFSGTIVTIRTMISEHSTAKTQARAFSWFAFANNLGIFLGPLIGGALAEPAVQFPGLFGGVRFFVDYPYALPSLAVGAISLTSVITTVLFVDETLPRELSRGRSVTGVGGDESTVAKPPAPKIRSLLETPGVPIVLYTYGHIMLLAFSYTSILTVFWYTPVDLGGFGFEPLQISLLMGASGLSQAIWILLIFPSLHRRVGTNDVLRMCALAYPFFFAICPLFNLVLRSGAVGLFWALAPVTLCVGVGVSMAFTAIQLALNDVSPSPAALATLNAVALAIVSGVRAFSPALFTSLFAVGVHTQWLWGHTVWVVMVVLAAGFTVLSRYMPDYEELKRQREWARIEREAEERAHWFWVD